MNEIDYLHARMVHDRASEKRFFVVVLWAVFLAGMAVHWIFGPMVEEIVAHIPGLQ